MPVFELVKTAEFDKWLKNLKNRTAKTAIDARLIRLARGHFGDAKPIKGCICELRFHLGAGYRVYYAKYQGKMLLLLCGGAKDSQSRDIQRAEILFQNWEREYGHEK